MSNGDFRKFREFATAFINVESALIQKNRDAPTPFAIVTRSGRIRYANVAWEHYTGWTQHDLKSFASWFSIVHPDDHQRLVDLTVTMGARDVPPDDAVILRVRLKDHARHIPMAFSAGQWAEFCDLACVQAQATTHATE